MRNQNKEDYIKAIYHLEEELNKPIKSIELAKYLRISKPSISEIIRKLINLRLINFKDKKLSLTKKGLREAEKITYRHRIIEVFLTRVLKLKSGVHEEGNKLEHAFSDKSVRKLSILLKNPQFCPHDKPIPKMKNRK